MNKIKKSFALGLTIMLITCSLSGCGKDNSIKVDAEDANGIIQTANTFMRHHSSDSGKEETVYVIADASGNPVDTIVSAWLKNPDGESSIEDVSFLNNIVNTKGNETFSENGNGHISWMARSNARHRQGKKASFV